MATGGEGDAERDELEEKLQDKQRQQGWNRDPLKTSNEQPGQHQDHYEHWRRNGIGYGRWFMDRKSRGKNDKIACDMSREKTAQSKKACDVEAAGGQAQDERKRVQPKSAF
jgi:hypothetical protein